MPRDRSSGPFTLDDPIYSWSKAQLYFKCGEAFRRRYVEGHKIPPALAMHVGTGMHVGAEVNGEQKIITHEDLPESDVVDAAVEGFRERFKDDGYEKGEDLKGKSDVVVEGLGVDEVVKLAKVYIKSASPKIQPVAVEEKYLMDMGKAKVLCYVDVVDDKERVIDYKSSGKKMPDGSGKQLNAADSSDQLTVYAAAYFQTHGKLPKAVGIETMVKTKDPYHQSLTSTRTKADVKRVGTLFSALHKGVKAGVFAPAVGTVQCSPSMCGYYKTCKFVHGKKRKK